MRNLLVGVSRSIVLRLTNMIPRKMDLDTPTSKLRIEIHQSQQIICANKHMNGRGHIGKGLQRIHLIEQEAATRHLFQVLCLINDEGTRITLLQAFLEDPT